MVVRLRAIALVSASVAAAVLLILALRQSVEPERPAAKQKSYPHVSAPAMAQEQYVSCSVPPPIADRTGLASIDIGLHVSFGSDFDEQRQVTFDSPSDVQATSIRAFFSDGDVVEFVDPEGIESVDPMTAGAVCDKVSFLTIGHFVIVKFFLVQGNPFPGEYLWGVDTRLREQLDMRAKFKGVSYLEQATPECIRDVERGHPGREDFWCVSETDPEPRLVEQRMVLNQAPYKAKPEDYYWFRCNRSSGTAVILEPRRSISVDGTDAVSDPDVLALMQERCEEWAREGQRN